LPSKLLAETGVVIIACTTGNDIITIPTSTIRRIFGETSTIAAEMISTIGILRRCEFLFTTRSGRITIHKIAFTTRVPTFAWTYFRNQVPWPGSREGCYRLFHLFSTLLRCRCRPVFEGEDAPCNRVFKPFGVGFDSVDRVHASLSSSLTGEQIVGSLVWWR